MSVKVNYKGNEILSYNENGTKTLKTSGKYCEDDITIVNTQDGGITPTGSIEITENGTYDVTEKASAVVNVSGGVSGVGVTSWGTFYKMPTFDLAEWGIVGAPRAGAWQNASGVTKLIIPKTFIGGGAATLFNGMQDLVEIELNQTGVFNTGNSTFTNCTNLETVVFSDDLTAFSTGYRTFEDCTKLNNVHTKNITTIPDYSFKGIGTNKDLYIEKTDGLVTLGGTHQSFTDNRWHVPASLFEEYKVATNWSVCYQAGALVGDL